MDNNNVLILLLYNIENKKVVATTSVYGSPMSNSWAEIDEVIGNCTCL